MATTSSAITTRTSARDLITLAGMAASLAIIAATFPLLRHMTGADMARND
jgi:hypothetical protein